MQLGSNGDSMSVVIGEEDSGFVAKASRQRGHAEYVEKGRIGSLGFEIKYGRVFFFSEVLESLRRQISLAPQNVVFIMTTA